MSRVRKSSTSARRPPRVRRDATDEFIPVNALYREVPNLESVRASVEACAVAVAEVEGRRLYT